MVNVGLKSTVTVLLRPTFTILGEVHEWGGVSLQASSLGVLAAWWEKEGDLAT